MLAPSAKNSIKAQKIRAFFVWFYIFKSSISNMMLVQKSGKVCVGDYNSFIGHMLLSIEHLFM